MDPGLNNLLKWSIENAGPSAPSSNDTEAQAGQRPSDRHLNADALRALMGGPNDADLMRESMAAIQNPDISLENKLVAFDNFEQLIENIDNANNMQPMGLWTPLVELLGSEEAELRRMAAWCMGTAVQNSAKAQERLLVVGAIPILVHLGIEDPNEPVRRKAIYALSSGVRNYQPALDAALRTLPAAVSHAVGERHDAGNMEAVDILINELRRRSQEGTTDSGSTT